MTGLNELKARIADKAFKLLRRSLYVIRVDTGSCNGCEIEIFAALTPLYDLERFGVRVVVSPRHADAMVVTGPITRQFYPVLKSVYDMLPEPKLVIAVGACACGGGVWYDSYAVHGGADQVIPVDVYVPGCPPHPAAILHGVLLALDVLEQKIRKSEYSESEPLRGWKIKGSLAVVLGREGVQEVPWELYRELDAMARKHLGYLYGAQLLRDYIEELKRLGPSRVDEVVARVWDAWNRDPRVREVLDRMADVTRRFLERGG